MRNERGMEFSPEKTNIRRVKDGFDFLGWNFRLHWNEGVKNAKAWKRAKSKFVTLVTPSKKSVASLTSRIKEMNRKYIGMAAWIYISKQLGSFEENIQTNYGDG